MVEMIKMNREKNHRIGGFCFTFVFLRGIVLILYASSL